MKLDDATLEQLMIDRSLGALDPAVAALLDAYLQTNPAMVERSREYQETVALASVTMSASDHGVLPEFPFRRASAVEKQIAWRGRLVKISAVAASFLIGAVLSFAITKRTSPHVPESPSPVVIVPQAIPVAIPQTAEKNVESNPEGIWSVQRLQKLAAVERYPCSSMQLAQWAQWQNHQKGKGL